jgi:uncharacterized protein (UPF0297 family)
MDTEKARSYLKTFLEVSEIQISIKESAIKRKNSWKRILDRSKISAVNAKIMELIEEKHKIQGRLDCVRFEMLDMILDEPSLVSDKLLAKKGYSSVTQIVGYLISNDIGYIPDFDDNRNKMATLDRTLILENMMNEYLR